MTAATPSIATYDLARVEGARRSGRVRHIGIRLHNDSSCRWCILIEKFGILTEILLPPRHTIPVGVKVGAVGDFVVEDATIRFFDKKRNKS